MLGRSKRYDVEWEEDEIELPVVKEGFCKASIILEGGGKYKNCLEYTFTADTVSGAKQKGVDFIDKHIYNVGPKQAADDYMLKLPDGSILNRTLIASITFFTTMKDVERDRRWD